MQGVFVPVRYSIPVKAASLSEEMDKWHEQKNNYCTVKAFIALQSHLLHCKSIYCTAEALT